MFLLLLIYLNPFPSTATLLVLHPFIITFTGNNHYEHTSSKPIRPEPNNQTAAGTGTGEIVLNLPDTDRSSKSLEENLRRKSRPLFDIPKIYFKNNNYFLRVNELYCVTVLSVLIDDMKQ
jgi:hypothetical protein